MVLVWGSGEFHCELSKLRLRVCSRTMLGVAQSAAGADQGGLGSAAKRPRGRPRGQKGMSHWLCRYNRSQAAQEDAGRQAQRETNLAKAQLTRRLNVARRRQEKSVLARIGVAELFCMLMGLSVL